jgi:hypothetical protein
MSTTRPAPPHARKGRAMTLTLDLDADQLLRAMVPSRKALGLMLSELIRKEAECRAQRPYLLVALAAEASEQGA